jgi:CRISPR-associated exonuclease Cas4
VGYSAAEVERFTYCPLSWALARGGIAAQDEAAGRGTVAHAAVGQKVARWRVFVKEHQEALQTALYLALVAASAATLAIEITFLDFTGIFNRVLMLMGLVWLLIALAFLLRAIWKEEEAHEFVKSHGLVIGELAYSDLDRPAETLRSQKYELSGRPDYIVRRKGSYIPVELKTGKTPDKPHDSHLMQLGVYCLLVEEKYGKRPTHGVLQYPERAFEVPFTNEFRDQVFETVLRMKLAEVTGTVHRNHMRVGKCRGCSRRDACAERLA